MADLTIDDLERVLELARKHGVQQLSFNGIACVFRQQAPLAGARPPNDPLARAPGDRPIPKNIEEKIKNDPLFEGFEHGLPVGT